jgi:hypothetical protein
MISAGIATERRATMQLASAIAIDIRKVAFIETTTFKEKSQILRSHPYRK